MRTVSASEIEAGRLTLSRLDPALAMAHEVTPPFAWRVKPCGFAGLVRLVLEQQVSVASANALWQRLETALGKVGVDEVLASDVDKLRLLGLSGQKARYVRAIAEAQVAGTIDFLTLPKLDTESACAKLIAIKGIGRWTAEAYLTGCEGRVDILPAGDIALQEAIRILDRLLVRPTEKALYIRAESWRPYRGIAAHLLWGYYTGIKLKTIMMPTDAPPLVAAALEVAAGPKGHAAKSTLAKRKKGRANHGAHLRDR
jgi:DNA-3-methyladenine glycosylase II